MKITPEQVHKVSKLARVKLSDDEVAVVAGQLSRVVEHFEELDELDTGAVEPTSHVVPLSCRKRPDIVGESLPREAVLSRAPTREEEYFLVPKVID